MEAVTVAFWNLCFSVAVEWMCASRLAEDYEAICHKADIALNYMARSDWPLYAPVKVLMEHSYVLSQSEPNCFSVQNLVARDLTQFKEQLHQMWFRFYTRETRDDTCG